MALESMTSQSMTSQQIAQDETLLGGYAYQIIRQQSKRIFKLRSQVLSDTDTEPLHQMRIGTRRLRSALALFADVVEIADPAKADQPAKAVGKLTKALGKVRDLDVMREWFERTLITFENADSSASGIACGDFSKKEKKTIKTLLKKLKKQRKKQFSRLEKTFDRKADEKLDQALKQWIKQPVFSPAAQQPASREAALRIIGPLTELLQHPGWLVATRKQGNQIKPIGSITLLKINQLFDQEGENLHDLRKQIKNIRYQTEFFRGLYDITYAAQVREFRNLQSILGQLQDQIVVGQFLAGELGSDWAQQLPTVEAAFQASRLDLWQQWQPYQRKYLKLRSSLPAGSVAA